MRKNYKVIRHVLSGGRVTIDETLRKKAGIDIDGFVMMQVRNGRLEIVPVELLPRIKR